MKQELTKGNVTKSLLLFATPMIVGNLLQQLYSIVDTIIVGKYLGADALAAVGSTYTLTTFLYSVIIGLCMGSGALFSYTYGLKDYKKLKEIIKISFLMIAMTAILIEILTLFGSGSLIVLLKTPKKIQSMTLSYVKIILSGIIMIFLYNYFAFLQRAKGNSVVSMVFLAISTALNIILDLYFVIGCHMGVEGAAYATLISQIVSGVGILIHTFITMPEFRKSFKRVDMSKRQIKEVVTMSVGASAQQSVMNFGILMIQGLVNSFGTVVMAAFTVAVKIDTLAYMPAQEFANAFSLFISQNYGAREYERIRKGTRSALMISVSFCLTISIIVVVFARQLMTIFINPGETAVILTGVHYLRIEGSFYLGIGILFLWYAYYRGMNRPGISLLLTVVSLGSRVVLAYALAPIPAVGVTGIWAAIPIGWFLADVIGLLIMKRRPEKIVHK